MKVESMRTELAIVGAGPAGMAAAEVAADCGIDVTVIDEQAAPGGQIYRQPPSEFVVPDWLEESLYAAGKALLRRVSGDDRIRRIGGATVSGILPAIETGADGRFTLIVDGSSDVRRIASESVLVAPGCYDMPVLFPGWNLPGVMAAGGIQAFVKSQRFVPGQRFLFVGSHPLQLVVADQLVRAGADVAGVLFVQGRRRALQLLKSPAAAWRGRGKLVQAAGILRRLRRAGVPVRFGETLLCAKGKDCLDGVVVAPVGPDGTADRAKSRIIDCDCVGVCFGFVASSELARQAGAATAWNAPRGGWIATHDHWMRTTMPGLYVAGEITGVAGADVAAEEGRLAALACALDLGRIDASRANRLARGPRRALESLNRFGDLLSDLSWPGDRCLDQWQTDPEVNLCKCEEVTVGNFVAQLEQNPHVTAANSAKLLTRVGMGLCQGRYCQFAVTRLVARLSGEPEAVVGGFTARFPAKPMDISALLSSDP